MRYPISNSTLDAGDICIIGRKGTGKTYAAKGLVERLIRRGRRVVIVDPMGIWWGLRVAADGGAGGLPVVVVGGREADIPVADPTEAVGVHVGKLLLGTSVSAVIDVSDMKRPSNLQFVAGLLRELYEGHATRDPLWIVLEEADVFAPQGARSSDERTVFAEVELLARRGRSKGFRLISITQRPARLHKDVLTQFDTMAVLALPGRHDRLAVRGWMEGVTEDTTEIYNSLPTLSVGDAWIWTPQEKRLVREHFPLIATYDTSSTPAPGSARPPKSGISVAQLAELKAAFDSLQGVAGEGKRRRTRGVSPTAAGAALVRLRERLRLTQAELAELIGSQQKSISRVESGRTSVSTRILDLIAEKTEAELRIEFVPKEKK
jgi:DNA-binding XRE family transcriptional regulator